MSKMQMSKPFMGSLRRTYHPGIWIQYSASQHHTALHARVQRLQVCVCVCTKQVVWARCVLDRYLGGVEHNTMQLIPCLPECKRYRYVCTTEKVVQSRCVVNGCLGSVQHNCPSHCCAFQGVEITGVCILQNRLCGPGVS